MAVAGAAGPRVAAAAAGRGRTLRACARIAPLRACRPAATVRAARAVRLVRCSGEGSSGTRSSDEGAASADAAVRQRARDAAAAAGGERNARVDVPRHRATQSDDGDDATRAARSRDATSSGRDDVFDEVDDSLRSPSLLPPRFVGTPFHWRWRWRWPKSLRWRDLRDSYVDFREGLFRFLVYNVVYNAVALLDNVLLLPINTPALLHMAESERSAKKRRNRAYSETVVRDVNRLEAAMRALSDKELREMTPKLRARLAKGSTLDELLPEAFAVVREVSRRVMGLRHYDVQIMGGAVLHEGNVAEMATGEGKTLVATLAVYLNALPRRGSVFVVTVNEYLAKRDSTTLGRLYQALGLTCGCVLESMSTEQAVTTLGYGADVTYVTAQQLGFDYLRDTTAAHPSVLRLRRPFWFAIVDEVDSVLIDEARTPMVLTFPCRDVATDRFVAADKVARQLLKDTDYTVNLKERNVMLTDAGVVEAGRLLQSAGAQFDDLFTAGDDSWARKVSDVLAVKEKLLKRARKYDSKAVSVAMKLRLDEHYTVDRSEPGIMLTGAGMAEAKRLLLRAGEPTIDLFAGSDSWGFKVTVAVTAKELFELDKEYILRDGKAVIVDAATGRMRQESRWTENIHQAIEAKEGLEVKAEQTPVASSTYQAFFKLFPKLAGMSGTVASELGELFDTYGVDVVTVPPNKPLARIDNPFEMMLDEEAKWNRVAQLVAHYYAYGQPVIVGTANVELSDKLSERLKNYDGKYHIPHNLLNARPENIALEAAIVAQAGRSSAVTIATNMAGRGTDVMLGGNPLGLARIVMAAHLFPAFGLALPKALLADEAGFQLKPDVRRWLTQAADAARFRCRGGKGETASSVFELIDCALERADTRQVQDVYGVDAAADSLICFEDFENSLAYVALWVLHDCKAQCAADAEIVRQLGGLHVIGTGFNNSPRVDKQLRGRAGRQGDPGASAFVLSTQDNIFFIYRDLPAVKALLDALYSYDQSVVDVFSKGITPIIGMVQEQIDTDARNARRNIADCDAVLHLHREVVLGLRRKVLHDAPEQRRARFFRFFEELVDKILADEHFSIITGPNKWAVGSLLQQCRDATWNDFEPDGRGSGLRKLINFLPNVTEEDLKVALTYDLPLPTGLDMPPVNASGETLTMTLWTVKTWSDTDLTYADYEDADKANEAARMVLNQNIEKRLAQTKLPPLPLKTWAPQKARLRAFLLEYFAQLYDDRVARMQHLGLRTSAFDADGLGAALEAIDYEWGRHLAKMELLLCSSKLCAHTVRDPLSEYKAQGNDALAALLDRIRVACIRSLFDPCNPYQWANAPARVASPHPKDLEDLQDLAWRAVYDEPYKAWLAERGESYQAWLADAKLKVPDHPPESVHRVFWCCYHVTWWLSMVVLASTIVDTARRAGKEPAAAFAAVAAAAPHAAEEARPSPPQDDARG